MNPNKFRCLSQLLGSALLALCGLVALSSCGGGSPMGSMMSGNNSMAGNGMTGAQSCTGMKCGIAYVTLTDASGDFVSYTVAVTSLALKRADGTTVETLPSTATVDFTQLVDLSELVSAVDV